MHHCWLPASSASSHSGDQAGLPAVVEELLAEVVADGFVLYCCGARTAPSALIASYEWAHCIDLITIRDFDRVTTARVPKRGTVDLFAPEVVVWAYEGPPQQALRGLLELVHPAHPDAPNRRVPGPALPAHPPDRATSHDDPLPVTGTGPGCEPTASRP